ncbi:hypothetical protein HDU97_001254 [Phlyctochytrium planicorne]|nr:hypothetical protein HDU97_001254 [Phlyctochytrium planicorne]
MLNTRQTTGVVLMVLNSVFMLGTTLIYFLRRKHRDIKPTAPMLTILQAISGWSVTTTTLALLGFKSRFPSFVFFWSVNIFMLLWMCSVMARAMRLTILSHWHQGRLQETREKKLGNIFAFTKKSISSLDEDEEAEERLGMLQKMRKNGLAILRPLYERFEDEDDKDDLGRDPEQWLGSAMGRIIIIALVAMIGGCIALQILNPKPVRLSPMAINPELRKMVKTHLLTLEVVGGMFLMVFVPGFLYTIWHVRDVNGIKFDIMVTLFTSIPSLISWALYLFMVTDKVKEIPVMYFSGILFPIVHVTSVVLPIARSYHTHLRIFMMHQEDSNPALFSSIEKAKNSTLERAKKVVYKEDFEDMEGGKVGKDENQASRPPIKMSTTEVQFERMLADPKLMEQFRTVSARDFSYTRVMLYDACMEVKALLEDSLPSRSPTSVMSSSTLFIDDFNFTSPSTLVAPASFAMTTEIKSPPTILVRDMGLVVGGLSTKDFDDAGMTDAKIMVVKRCHEIWRVFLKKGGLMEVEISEGAKERVKNQIQNGRFDRSVLDEVMTENTEILFKDVFPKFVRAYNANSI